MIKFKFSQFYEQTEMQKKDCTFLGFFSNPWQFDELANKSENLVVLETFCVSIGDKSELSSYIMCKSS